MFSFKKMHLKMSSATWRPFWFGFNASLFIEHVHFMWIQNNTFHQNLDQISFFSNRETNVISLPCQVTRSYTVPVYVMPSAYFLWITMFLFMFVLAVRGQYANLLFSLWYISSGFYYIYAQFKCLFNSGIDECDAYHFSGELWSIAKSQYG